MKQGAIGRPLAVLTLCVVVIGGGLAWFTVRAAIQERTIAEQEAREATARAARHTAEAVVPALEALARQLSPADRARPGPPISPDGILPTGSPTAADDASEVLVRDDRVVLAVRAGRATPVHPSRLLYGLEGQATGDEPAWPAAMQEAESLELRARDYPRAIAAYRQVLARGQADPRVRLAAQQRLARSLRNAGRTAEALEALGALTLEFRADRSAVVAAAWHDRCAMLRAENHSGSNSSRRNESGIDFRGRDAAGPGRLTADGVGDSPDACADEFYAGLVDGRWELEPSLYHFYAEEARGWLAPDGVAPSAKQRAAQLRERETVLLARTRAAEAGLAAWRARDAGLDAGYAVRTDTAPPLVIVWSGSQEGDATIEVLGPGAAGRVVWMPLVARIAPGHHVVVSANRAVMAVAGSDGARPDAGPDAGLDAGSNAGPDAAPEPAADAAAHTAADAGSGATPAGPGAVELATATVEDRGVVWRVTAAPDPGQGRDRGSRIRSGIYLGTLGLMLLSVSLAGYFAIRTVRKELEVARLKSEFISAVSHEFRSPLSAISHLAELLDNGRVTGEERTREYYGLIRGEAGRLRRLVENLLDFARIEEGRQEYRFETLDVAAWLARTVDEFRAIPASSGRPVNVAMGEALPAVRADSDALARALMNLLDNAVKYSPTGSAVWIEAAAAGGWIEIRVRDDGAGIAPEDLPHVFERFYRGRDTEGVGGTGLGLALVQRIVEAHGGSVAVESSVGAGSTFTIRLPAMTVAV